MGKVLLRLITDDGQIQEGIIKIVPSKYSINLLHCELDEGVERNYRILDSVNDVIPKSIRGVLPYFVDTDKTSNVKDTSKTHRYTEEELTRLDSEELEDLAKLFNINYDELFDSEIILEILDRQEHCNF